MNDTISIDRAKLLHPKVSQEVINIITEIEHNIFPKSIRIRIAQGLRTIDEQNELYAQGRTKPGKIITKAKGGSSYHNYGLAIDFALLYDKDGNGEFEELSWDTAKDFDKNGMADWKSVVTLFEAHGWEWGGRWRTFSDLPHVQKTFEYRWQALLDKYLKNDFVPGTRYVNI